MGSVHRLCKKAAEYIIFLAPFDQLTMQY
jgi:hypothetical protein